MKVKVIKALAHEAEAKLQAWFDEHRTIKLESISTAIEDGYLHITIAYLD
jgi:hypothetical protein